MKTYYNTTGEPDADVKKFRKMNEWQDREVLERCIILASYKSFITKKKGVDIRASIVWSAMRQYPITSIRRSLNTLEACGKIRKSGRKQPGMYGRNETIYELV